jgi:hypothetical protein
MVGEWGKLQNEEFHYLYTSPNVITVIKSRRIRCAGHLARMGEKRNTLRVLIGTPEGRRPPG